MRMPVSICGELAAAPKLTPLLLGLGVRSLSMNASAVPKVKQVIRSVEIDTCVRFARRVMEQGDSERLRAMIDSFGRE
jgi:phosphotransferase system enzyme I (PtsI)